MDFRTNQLDLTQAQSISIYMLTATFRIKYAGKSRIGKKQYDLFQQLRRVDSVATTMNVSLRDLKDHTEDRSY